MLDQNDWPIEPAVNFLRGVFSAPSEADNGLRAQSSIPPPNFYGCLARAGPSSTLPLPATSPPQPRNTSRETVRSPEGSKLLNSKSQLSVATFPNCTPPSNKRGFQHHASDEPMKVAFTGTIIDLEDEDSCPEPEARNSKHDSNVQPVHSHNRQRPRSMPPKAVSREAERFIEAQHSTSRDEIRRRALHDLSLNTSISRDELTHIIDEALEKRLPKFLTARHHWPEPPRAGPVAAETRGPSRSRSKRRIPTAERKLKLPPITDFGPERLPESEIIRIGKIVNHYERHCAAPYAFSWRGRLLEPYHHVLTKLGDDGETVWTAKEIRRL
ncbi:MAG: hypothetical protein Q9217_004309 [Psora testacea]